MNGRSARGVGTSILLTGALALMAACAPSHGALTAESPHAGAGDVGHARVTRAPSAARARAVTTSPSSPPTITAPTTAPPTTAPPTPVAPPPPPPPPGQVLTPAPTAPPPPPPTTGAVASTPVHLAPGEALRILVVGDSVAATFTPAAAGAATELTRRGIPATVTKADTRPGWGLTSDRPGVLEWSGGVPGATLPPPDWYATWRTDLVRDVAAERPHIVLVLAGAWDAVPRQAESGAWLSPGTAPWAAWYSPRVVDADRALAATGALVVWLRYPCLRDITQTARVERVMDTIRGANSSVPRTTMIDLSSAVCPGGIYADALPPPGGGAPVPLRMSDGIHFDFYGAPAVVSPWLADQLEAFVTVG